MSNTINRSHEVIANLKKANREDSAYAYAYAFGWAWGMLSEKERKRMLEMAEAKLTEKEEN
jgi:acyl-CoA reductase-like NAD-dependent aldehyde dehydrogenase